MFSKFINDYKKSMNEVGKVKSLVLHILAILLVAGLIAVFYLVKDPRVTTAIGLICLALWAYFAFFKKSRQKF